MIEWLRQLWQTVSHTAAVLTDWLLISSGLLLAGIALLRIDVPPAKWVLFACCLLPAVQFRRLPLPPSAAVQAGVTGGNAAFSPCASF